MPATLRSLRIRHLALVESLDWSLKPGFNVVTGETGAGKSIILGALTLVLGERADKSLIRTGADQCSVEAAFDLGNTSKLNRFLEERGIEPCEDGQLLLKRVFTSSGTNRQFINGSQTTLANLREVGAGLVDLHGPHDHQSLFSRDQQRAIIDAYADAAELLQRYGAEFSFLLPPFPPAAERCAFTWVESIICVSADRPFSASRRNRFSQIPRSAQRANRL